MSIKSINGEIIKIGDSDVEISSTGISIGAGKQINFGDGTSLSSYASPSVYEFTTISAPASATGANGPWVWTPPTCNIVEFLLIGGGGGGGSGSRQPTNTHRYGGGGGGGGGFVCFTVPRNLITNPISIKVGSGGGGGASRTSDSSNGSAGSQGVATLLGWTGLTSSNGGYGSNAPYIFRIEGGFGGGGGTTSGATSGSGGRVTSPGSASYALFQGGPGGIPSITGITPGRIGHATIGGGAGGTVSSGGQYGVGGNIDLAGYCTDSSLFYAFTNSNLIGTLTKHGGDSKNNQNSDNGSTGIGYGGGGGGGGASNNGYNSGAGGNGAGGYVRIICW